VKFPCGDVPGLRQVNRRTQLHPDIRRNRDRTGTYDDAAFAVTMPAAVSWVQGLELLQSIPRTDAQSFE